MADANEQTTGEQTTQKATDESKDDLIPRSEAKKAFEARDKAKEQAQKLKEKLDAYEAAERDREAKLEEDRLKQAGQWDAIKQTLITKHQAEVEAERKARLELESSYTKEKIEAAFLGASEWFGGESAKTIFTGDMAYAYLGKYVSYEDVEVSGTTRKAIVVRDLDGNLMVDGRGNPAKFAEAIGELIASLPNKDRILRGSGKAGSGNSGGVSGAPQHQGFIDASTLTPEQARDPNIIKRLQAQVRKGGQISGRAYN